MHHKVVSERKANNSKNKIVVNIACGLITITTIVCSLSPSNVKSNTISYSESGNYSIEKSNDSIVKEKVINSEVELPVDEAIVIKISEEPNNVDQLNYHGLTNDEKIQVILTIHNITEFEFYQIVSTVAYEAGPNNYSECYDVVTTMYNRTFSKGCCNYVRAVSGKDGTNIMDQIKCKGQFAGFLPSEAGYDKDKFIDTAAYQATIDFLYSMERSHNYLSFNAPWYEGCPSYAIQLNPECKGNKYFNELTLEDLNQKAIDCGVNLGNGR